MIVDFPVWTLLQILFDGAKWTVALSLLAFVLGGSVALVILMARVSSVQILRRLTHYYIELFQGTPLLMQLFIIFFGLSLAGVDISPWLAAALGLTLFSSAYLAEVWRGCVESIPRVQWEGASSLAMTYTQQMRYVILPQALRISVAPTVGFTVQIVKGTAVTSIIGFNELTKAGSMLANATFKPMLMYGLVAAYYFVICYALSLLAKRLERKLNVSRTR